MWAWNVAGSEGVREGGLRRRGERGRVGREEVVVGGGEEEGGWTGMGEW